MIRWVIVLETEKITISLLFMHYSRRQQGRQALVYDEREENQ